MAACAAVLAVLAAASAAVAASPALPDAGHGSFPSAPPPPHALPLHSDAVAPLAFLPVVYANHMQACDPNPPLGLSHVGIDAIGFLSDNGVYKIGDVIQINVNSSGGVTTWSGHRTLLEHSSILLETGSVDRHATFSHSRFSGTDSSNLPYANDLVYSYTVRAGDSSDDLDYVDIYSLYWNGEGHNLNDIVDFDSHDCRLPVPGTDGSLSYGANIAVDGVVPSALAVRSNVSDGTHPDGTPIAIDVMFNETVVVAGAPRIELETGSTDAYALYSTGNESGTLTFVYTAQDGHVTADLDYKGSLDLNGGAVADVAGNNASLDLPAPGSPGSLGGSGDIRIGIESAIATNVTSTNSSGLYSEDATIAIAVGFSRPVAVSGTPTLELSTVPARNASYAGGGSPSATLVFLYAIADGDISDRLAYAGRGALKMGAGASIVDPSTGLVALVGLPANGSLGASKAIAIDAADPEAVSASPLNGTGIYKEGERIAINVTFTEPVVVAGAPLLALETGTTDRQAVYAAGNGSAALTFAYQVRDGDAAANLDYANSSALTAGAGASIMDAAGNDAVLALPDPGTDGLLGPFMPIVVDTTAPEAMLAMSLNMTGMYDIGDRIAIRINFTENVIVEGEPRLALETGETDRQATYSSGNGSAALAFVYQVQLGDISADLDYANSSALALHGEAASIRDAAGHDANLTLPPPGGGLLAGDDPIIVDATGADVLYVTSDTPDGAYMAGEAIDIRVVFNENVTVGGAGAPLLALETGTTDRQARYYGGNGSAALTFLYAVQQGDNTGDLNYANDTALALNGSTIRDAADIDAFLTLPPTDSNGSLAHSKDIAIDTMAPSAKSASSLNATGTYRAGARIAINVTFTEPVVVAGAPLLALETGYIDRQAVYAAGNNSAALTFLYTVQVGDNTGNLDYANSSALTAGSGASIMDAAGNGAVLALPDPGTDGLIGALTPVAIDAIAPEAVRASSPNATGTYGIGARIAITVNFTEAVIVAGTPRLALETGDIDRQARYDSGNNSAALAFLYTVRAGDISADLDYANSRALTLHGEAASIRDAAGHNANLTLPPPGGGLLAGDDPIVINTTGAGVLRVTSGTPDGAYMAGEAIDIKVVFSENVTVGGAGAPLLVLETGVTDRRARYDSGSGSSTLAFLYTVQKGDGSEDLNYNDTNALALNGSTIMDTSGADAFLTLPPTDSDGSLAHSKDIAIDTMAPSAKSASSLNATGTYGTGTRIAINVTFTEPVVVAGAPLLALETGYIDRQAVYAAGNNSAALTFLYTVQAGDAAALLDYAGPGALTAGAGASIMDAAGNDAVLALPSPGGEGSLAGSAITIRTEGTVVAPAHRNATVVSAAFTARNTATITYSGGLDRPDGHEGAVYGSVSIEGGYTARIAPENVSGLGGATHTIRFGGPGVDGGQAGTISLATHLVGAAAAAAGDNATLRFAEPAVQVAPGETVRVVEQHEAVAPGAPPPPAVTIERDGFTRAVNATGAGNGARVAINVTGLASPAGAGAAPPDGTAEFPAEAVRMITAFAEVTFPVGVTALSVPPGGLIMLYASDDVPPGAEIAAALGLGDAGSLLVRQVVEIGYPTAHVAFDAPVRILLVGQSGGGAFYVNSTDGAVVPIAAQCDEDSTKGAAMQLGDSGECWIDTPAGGKVIHTYHLTRFGTAEAADGPPPRPPGAPEAVSASVLQRASGDPLRAPTLYTAGQAIAIAVDFSAPVSVGLAGNGGAPHLLLDTGSAGAAAPYASGNGTARLEFSYTVRGGDITDRLSYAGTGALALGGGSIAAAGQGAPVAASVALPPPGTPGSLSGPGSHAVRIAPIGRPVLDVGVLDEAGPAGFASRAAYMAAAEFNERQGRIDGALLVNVSAYGAGGATAGSAAEALRAAHSSGAGPSVYVGPSTDRGLHAAMPYASEHGIVLVSAGSTAPSLAVGDDTVFRLLPSDRLEAEALARLAYSGGDESVHMVVDNATYGPLLGGTLDDAALPPPQGGFFHAFGAALASAAISPLSSTATLGGGGGGEGGGPYEAGAAAAALDASVRLASVGGSPVSVVYLGSPEGLAALAESSASYPALASASWLASGLSAGSALLAGGGAAAGFAADTGLAAPSWSPPASEAGRQIDSRLPGMGPNERNGAYAAYDAVLVIGAAAAAASAEGGRGGGTTDAAAIADGLPAAAALHSGALGDIALDYAGDLWVPAKYDLWTIAQPGGAGTDAEWERQPEELDGERACSITLTRARIDYGPIDSGQTSRPHLQTIVNTGQLPFAQVDLTATPWHVDSPGACAPGDQPSLPVGLSEIRTELGGRFLDLAATGTTLAQGLEAGSLAPVWYRLSLTGYADLPQAQITQCATYVVRCS